MVIIAPPHNPGNKNHRYYFSHLKFYLDSFTHAGHEVRYDSRVPSPHQTKFEVIIERRRVLIDISDHPDVIDITPYAVAFKIHWNNHPGMIPLCPVSFYDWQQYYSLQPKISYQCKGKILNNQRPYGNALKRRTLIRQILVKRYKSLVDYEQTKPLEFFAKINNCVVSVCVPGATNDILDRGQLQYMGLGACTLAPPLIGFMPFGLKLEPNTHYVCCSPTYGDIIEKVDWCMEHPEECKQIGQNAKDLFQKACTPERISSWVLQNVIQQP